VVEAAFWGFLAASSLLVGAFVGIVFHPGNRLTGLVMAFGAGALISAVAYDLVLDALDVQDPGTLAIGMFLGGLAFFVGDALIDRLGGADRKRSTGAQAEGSSLAIVLGAALDGIPESIVLGLSLVLGGSVSVSFLAATFVSNLPEGMAATVGLERAGWRPRSILLLWLAVVGVSTLAAALGYGAFAQASELSGANVQAFAAGAVITMLADTMMPEAFEFGGPLVGLATVGGFVVALTISVYS
jgi:ZIP family zinc transporter